MFGAVGLLRFSHGVRTVDALGLFASGATFGAALAGVLGARKEPVDWSLPPRMM
jgi:hypothetical protein